jgi:hypothetical protein
LNLSKSWWLAVAGLAAIGWFVSRHVRDYAGPAVVLSLHDAAGNIELDSSGGLHAPDAFSKDGRRTVAAVLNTHALPMAAVPADLAAVPGSMPQPADLYPAGVSVLSDTPEFHWPAVEGSSGYEITIFDSEFRELDSSGRTIKNAWAPVRPLTRGALYQWQITTWQGDKQDVTPAGSGIKFRVLDQAAAKRVEAALDDRAPSHLLAAALCASAGLKPEARQQLDALAAANPGSPFVQELIAGVR